MNKIKTLFRGGATLAVMAIAGSALLVQIKVCSAAELVEMKIYAVDSVSGKTVPGAWINIRAQQPSGEWPIAAGEATNPQGFVLFQVSGDGFLIQAEKEGYEWFSYGGCSGYLLAKVIWPEDIRTVHSISFVQLTEEREVTVSQVIKYVETKVYITPKLEKAPKTQRKESLVSR